MTLWEFLSDRAGRIALQLIVAGLTALFLLATGTQPGILIILLIALLLVFLIVNMLDFFRQRTRLLELETILKGLDRKYLFAECIPPPKGLYEQRLFDLTRRAGRAMTGAVSDAQARQREYREYVERWVHEIKAPITAARLICRELDGDPRRKLMAELAQIEANIERTLFYARAENPEQDCLFRQTDLGKIAAQAIENHRSLLIQSGVRVKTENLNGVVYTDEYNLWCRITASASLLMNCPACMTGALPAATDGSGAVPPAWGCTCAGSWPLFWIWDFKSHQRKEKGQL